MEVRAFKFTEELFNDLAMFMGYEKAREELINIFTIELDGYIAYMKRRIEERQWALSHLAGLA